MSKKIEVSKELMDQIIDCYVNQQLSLQKTSAKLNLPFTLNVLKRLLKEQGVHIRTYQEAANCGLRGPIPQDISKQIISLYIRGYSMERIQKELSQFYSTDKIKKTLLENNIQLRTLEESKKCQMLSETRKYLINDNYCLESHNGAWILGMYSADGYLPKASNGEGNRITLSLTRKDEEILYRIAEELEYEGPINQYLASDHVHEFSSLSFTSKILRRQFESYGIVNNKTFKLDKLPKLPDEYMIDYIRGYVDGDGTIVNHHGSPNISITSASRSFLEEIQEYIFKKHNLQSRIQSDHNAFDLHFNANESKILGHLMYDNNYLALKRKKDKFYEIIAPTSLNTPQG